MAIVGMTIGASFYVAMILGPLLGEWIGVANISPLAALFALLGIFLCGRSPCGDPLSPLGKRAKGEGRGVRKRRPSPLKGRGKYPSSHQR